jgi:hypothetical protein
MQFIMLQQCCTVSLTSVCSLKVPCITLKQNSAAPSPVFLAEQAPHALGNCRSPRQVVGQRVFLGAGRGRRRAAVRRVVLVLLALRLVRGVWVVLLQRAERAQPARRLQRRLRAGTFFRLAVLTSMCSGED